MRLRLIALGCALTGPLGFLALPQAAAHADTTVRSAAAKATLTLHGPATVGWTFTERTGAAGGFVVTDHNPAKAHYTYTAVFAGDAAAKSATAEVHVTVTTKPQISVSSPVTDNAYGAKVTLTVTLGPTFSDRHVSLYATPLGAARRLVATGTVNAHGKWYPTYSITRETTFTAVFAGDAHNARNRASRTLYAYALVANRITGYYKTNTSSSGIIYRVFHDTSTLTLYSKVTPNKHGECLEPETEQYDKGAGWHADTKYGCDSLDSASHDTAPFSLSQAADSRFRIRGDYFRSSKDTANLDAQGPWLYFIVK
jgi:hypothetical protein